MRANGASTNGTSGAVTDVPGVAELADGDATTELESVPRGEWDSPEARVSSFRHVGRNNKTETQAAGWIDLGANRWFGNKEQGRSRND